MAPLITASTKASRIRMVADATASGMGATLDDGTTICYVYTDSSQGVKRGYTTSAALLTGTDDSLTGVETLATLSGTIRDGPTISITNVDDRLLLLVAIRADGGSLTGSAKFPALTWGINCLESFDDGNSWSYVGKTVEATNRAISLGSWQRPSKLRSFAGRLVASFPWVETYFTGAAAGAYYFSSGDSGSTWTQSALGTPGPYADPFGTAMATVGGNLYAVRADTLAGSGSNETIQVSTNGTTWATVGASALGNGENGAILYNGGRYISLDGGGYYGEYSDTWLTSTVAKTRLVTLGAGDPSSISSSLDFDEALNGSALLAYGTRYVDVYRSGGWYTGQISFV